MPSPCRRGLPPEPSPPLNRRFEGHESGHGSWYYAVQVTTVGGRRARYRRGGFATREAAAAARQAILDGPAN